MNIKLTTASLLLASSLLGGCAITGIGEPEYACEGIPEGLRCMSAQDALKLTDGDDYKERIHDTAMAAQIAKEARDEGLSEQEVQERIAQELGRHTHADGSTTGGADESNGRSVRGNIQALEDRPMPGVVPYPVKKVLPLRTPAKVMRIAIHAWESKDGTLHVPGYVYTEIEKRRWMIGDREDHMQQRLNAVQTLSGGSSSSGESVSEQVNKFRQGLSNGPGASNNSRIYGVQ